MKMEKEVQILNLDDILPNRFQPRITFDEKAIMELSASIKEHGVIQPIVVRRIGDKYEIIAGERRYKASVLAGKTNIPALVVDLNDKDSAEIALIENVQRQDLTPIEEAVSYKKILDMGYLNQSDLAIKLGKTQSTIANKLRLLNLSDEVQEALLEERISERHARSLLKLDKENQNIMLNKIINERMTVRKTDDEIAKIMADPSILKTTQIEENNDMNNEIKPVEQLNTNQENEQSVEQPVQQIFNPNPVENANNNFKEQSFVVPTAQFGQAEPIVEPIVESSNINIPSDSQNMNMESTPIVQPITQFENIQPQPMMMNNQELPVQPVENIPASGRFFNEQEVSTTPQPVVADASIFEQPAPAVDPFKNIMPSEPIIEQPVQQVNQTEVPSVELPQTMPMSEPTSPVDQPLNPNDIPNMQSYRLDDNMNFNPNQSIVEIGGTGMIAEEPVLQPVMNVGPVPTQADLNDAISLIREACNKIEKMGFTIDSEELVLSGQYKFEITIDK